MKKIFAVILAACFPVILFAQTGPSPNTSYITDIIAGARDIMNVLIPILMTLATLYFLYTVFQFIKADEKDRNAKRDKMIAGIIGLFVIVSVWGLVRLLSYTVFGNNATTSVNVVPCPPGMAWDNNLKRCR